MSMPEENPLPLDAQMNAIFGALADTVFGEMKTRVRAVLERNPAIVNQAPASLDHLVNEIMSSVLPEEGMKFLRGDA